MTIVTRVSDLTREVILEFSGIVTSEEVEKETSEAKAFIQSEFDGQFCCLRIVDNAKSLKFNMMIFAEELLKIKEELLAPVKGQIIIVTKGGTMGYLISLLTRGKGVVRRCDTTDEAQRYALSLFRTQSH
jgi:hypothetical protein